MLSSRTSSSPLFSGLPCSQQASAHPFHYRQERKDLRRRKFVVELDMDSSSCCVMWGFSFDFFFLILVWFLKPLLVPKISLGESTSGFFFPLLLSKSSVFMMESWKYHKRDNHLSFEHARQKRAACWLFTNCVSVTSRDSITSFPRRSSLVLFFLLPPLNETSETVTILVHLLSLFLMQSFFFFLIIIILSIYFPIVLLL